MARPIEHQTVIEEVNQAYIRMVADTKMQSQEKRGNRFEDALYRLTSPILTRSLIDREEGYGRIVGKLDPLATAKMPEMIAMHNRMTKGGMIPSETGSFFQALARGNDWTYRRAEVTRSDVSAAQRLTEGMTQALEGDTPALWMYVKVIDAVVKGYKVKDYESLVGRFERGIQSINEAGVKRFLGLGTFVFLTFKHYLHPETFKIVPEVIDGDADKFRGSGLILPTNADEIRSAAFNLSNDQGQEDNH